MVAHTLRTILFVGPVRGFGDAVAVEDQPRAFGELNLAFGKFSCSQPQRHSAFAVQKARSLLIHQQRPQVTGAGKVNVRVDGFSTANNMVTNRPEGKSSASKRFSRVRTSPGPLQVCARERIMPRVADISSAAAVPFPETSARTSPQQPSSKEMKSYQSPPTAPAGIDKPGDSEAGDVRRTFRQQSLLNNARLGRLLAHPLALMPFVLEAPGVMYRHCQVVAQSLQHA